MRECDNPKCRYPATEELQGNWYCYNCFEILRDKAAFAQQKECTEPGCRYPAVKDFRGKKLCMDCWERYKAAQEQADLELKDM